MDTYKGELPKSLRVKKNTQQVIDDTVAWAKWIASNNDFHYGKGDAAHHNGCYFCGTQPAVKKNLKDYKKTYCCNPFIGAAWAHGGQDKKALSLCKTGKSWGFKKKNTSGNYYGSSKFNNLGHPVKTKLKPGDVLCRDTHVAMYVGNGKFVEASGGDDNKKNSEKWNNSIKVKTLTDAKYKKFPRVHRYNSSVNRDINITEGEYSERVKQIQQFLNWYGNYKLVEDGKFYDSTKKAVKSFQKATGLKVTGIVDKSTLAKIKAIKK